MLTYNNMLMVGSIARNTGKTSFCIAFIDKWKKEFDIYCLKVTTIREGESICHHGSDGCGACTSFEGGFDICVEKNSAGHKDTNQLLAAGAKKVCWIRTKREYALQAFESVLCEIPKFALILCESNVLSEFVRPGASVLMQRDGITDVKPSAKAFRDNADFLCNISCNDNIERVLNAIKIDNYGRISAEKF